uniref:Uncharacterized protein n=1 Tax=Octopus bimaculoides TaxID=37653 RepID=A0A0L8GRC3_OCTBM
MMLLCIHEMSCTSSRSEGSVSCRKWCAIQDKVYTSSTPCHRNKHQICSPSRPCHTL